MGDITKADVGHRHTASDVRGGKFPIEMLPDDVVTQAELDDALAGVSVGDIEIADVTGLEAALAAKIPAFADPDADRIVFWDDSAGAFAPLLTADALPIDGTLLYVRSANTSQDGIVELATTTETQTGTDPYRAVTPYSLTSRTATDSRTGLVELATTAEATTGTDTMRAVTPAGLKAVADTKTDVPGSWVNATSASGWDVRTLAVRIHGGMVQMRMATPVRSSTSLTLTAGTPVTMGTIPAGYRPGATLAVAGLSRYGGTGAAILCEFRVMANGDLMMNPLTSGTLTTGGYVAPPYLEWVPEG